MPASDPQHLGRRTLVGAAWAAPVVALAASAPSAVASEAQTLLGARADGPTEYAESGSTVYAVYITNTGTETLDAGTITALLPEPGDGFSFSGFSGLLWSYADPFPDGQIAFRYDLALPAGEESDILLLLIDNNDRSQNPVPVADLLVTAPGFGVTVLPLEIPY